MSVTVSIDFNGWRESYDAMSFEEHQEFNKQIAAEYPNQRCWNDQQVGKFLRHYLPGSVVELGGWDGSLANVMLPRFPETVTWVNYDITPDVPQVCGDSRYEQVTLDDWPWKRKAAGDVLLASHVFEHMLSHEIVALLDAWDVAAVFMDAPIPSGSTSWNNYEGTHILEIGGTELLWRLGSAGWFVRHCDMSGGGMVAWLEREPA